MEEVKRKRGRPRKVVVETPKFDDPIDRQLQSPGGTFKEGEVAGWVMGTEVFFFKVRQRVIQPDGTVWILGDQNKSTSIYVPEREVRRRRNTNVPVTVE